MPRLYVKILLLCKIFEKRWPLFFQDYKTQAFYVRIFLFVKLCYAPDTAGLPWLALARTEGGG
jgi:hypothetical protein